MEMDDAAGNGLRINESVTKEIVAGCYTSDLERPRKITEVKVIVLLHILLLSQAFLFIFSFCGLFYGTVSISDYTASNVGIIDER